MAYLLLAVGALMAVAGVYAGVTGYGVVQVEVGWSSFIVGATLFAGGVVTMALGLVLRTLVQIKESFVHPRLAGSGEAIEPAIALEREEPAAPPVDLSAQRATPQLELSLDAGLAAPELAEVTRPVSQAPKVEPTPDDGYKLETPSTPEHDLVAADRAAVKEAPAKEAAARSARRTDDWLDRAFADLDRDVLANDTWDVAQSPVAPAKGEERTTVIDPPARDPAARGGREAASKVTSIAPAANYASAVIGRYEAEGTSYIMYADGSIEAQTTGGVYRFASMAELKAFIES